METKKKLIFKTISQNKVYTDTFEVQSWDNVQIVLIKPTINFDYGDQTFEEIRNIAESIKNSGRGIVEPIVIVSDTFDIDIYALEQELPAQLEFDFES